MKVTFHGAAREVTGSCHRLEAGGTSILLDCGMIQGGDENTGRNYRPFGFDPQSVEMVVLSHAHIDHCGRLPLLVREGFAGPILATPPTIDLCRIMLADSGRIQEEDARFKIKRLGAEGKDASWVRPLYTEQDARVALERFVPVPFEEPRPLGKAGIVNFVKAGHILGAAIVELGLREDGRTRTLTFSGDLGVDGARLMGAPRRVHRPDYLIIESTYGDRSRPVVEDKTEQLYGVIERTLGRGGKLIVPAFAVGRTQAILARINDLVEGGRLPGLEVFIDSPMASQASRVFGLYPEAYSADALRLLREGDDPLAFPGLHWVSSVEESKALNERAAPCVIIASSGMCTGGRIKHHLKNHLPDLRNTVLFVGYQATGTLGRAIQSGAPVVRIHGREVRVGAEVVTFEGFSEHADLDGLLGWFEGLRRIPARTFVVHGEEAVALAFARTLGEKFNAAVEVPQLGQSFDLP